MILRERRICTFAWLVSLATKEVTKQTLHQDGRQLQLKSEQNQQAAERRTWAESKWCDPLLQACRIRPWAGRADRTITHCRERPWQSRCRPSLLPAASPDSEWVVQVCIGFTSLFPWCLEDSGFPPPKGCWAGPLSNHFLKPCWIASFPQCFAFRSRNLYLHFTDPNPKAGWFLGPDFLLSGAGLYQSETRERGIHTKLSICC